MSFVAKVRIQICENFSCRKRLLHSNGRIVPRSGSIVFDRGYIYTHEIGGCGPSTLQRREAAQLTRFERKRVFQRHCDISVLQNTMKLFAAFHRSAQHPSHSTPPHQDQTDGMTSMKVAVVGLCVRRLDASSRS